MVADITTRQTREKTNRPDTFARPLAKRACRKALPFSEKSVSETCLTLEYIDRTLGMRRSSELLQSTSLRPRKFLVIAPINKTIARVKTTPKPGMCIPSNRSGCQATGSIKRVWSSVLTIRSSTHRVIASGTDTSKPASNQRQMAVMGLGMYWRWTLVPSLLQRHG